MKRIIYIYICLLVAAWRFAGRSSGVGNGDSRSSATQNIRYMSSSIFRLKQTRCSLTSDVWQFPFCVSPLVVYIFALLHGVIQAAQSEWKTLAASARPHDRGWLKQKLEQVNLRTLHRYVKDAGVPLGKNPNKEWCVAALLDKEFPVAPRFCRTLSIWVDSFFPLNLIGHISLCCWIMTVYVDIYEKKIYICLLVAAWRFAGRSSGVGNGDSRSSATQNIRYMSSSIFRFKQTRCSLTSDVWQFPFCVSPLVVYIFACVAWCDPGSSIGVEDASCFCASTW